MESRDPLRCLFSSQAVVVPSAIMSELMVATRAETSHPIVEQSFNSAFFKNQQEALISQIMLTASGGVAYGL